MSRETRNKHRTIEAIYQAIEPRLDKIGEITFAECWTTSIKQVGYTKVHSYNIFKYLLDTMVEQGKAYKKKGCYQIIRPNRRTLPLTGLEKDKQILSRIIKTS